VGDRLDVLVSGHPSRALAGKSRRAIYVRFRSAQKAFIRFAAASRAHMRVFIGCRSGALVVVDATNGTIVAAEKVHSRSSMRTVQTRIR